jgi:hypothetical protein
VRHGSQVETRGSWFCEAIWDHEFEDGDFDLTDLVFGSGGRLRKLKVVFVSSGTTVDRLQFLKLENKLLVSNSLPCLLAVGGIKVDHTYDRFQWFFQSIMKGIDSYEKRLPTLSGRLELTYYRNLVWDGRQLIEIDKPTPHRDFTTFLRYRTFLRESQEKIAANMQSATRNHRYEMVAGLSSGYDSTTVAVLAHELGGKHVFSFRTARGGQEDHGEEVARILGLDVTLVDRGNWQQHPFSEVPFFAAAALGGDTVLSSAGHILRGRVFLSGFHGDKVWAKDAKTLGPDIVRGDASGLAFTELRLALGCIHFPVPFVGVGQIRDINLLSNSSELSPWDVPGDYSRPICRRIVEEAGIPRDFFGMRKKAVTTHFGTGESTLNEETEAEYHRWLIENWKHWETTPFHRLRLPNRVLLTLRVLLTFRERYYAINHLLRGLNHYLPPAAESWMEGKNSELQCWLNRRLNLTQYLFPWAIDRMVDAYNSEKER